jgi:thiol-disulfide isomerase/thioredoxin
MRYAAVFAVALSAGSQMLPAKAPVPRPAKEFICSDAAGKKIALSSYKGKVLVVQFLSTTCSHCQAFSQLLTKLQAEYGPKGFQAVGVAFNEADAAMVRSYVEDHHIGIPVGFAPRGDVLGYLGVSVMDPGLRVPQVVVIDRAGQVRAQSDVGGTRELTEESSLRALIGRLLATPAAK